MTVDDPREGMIDALARHAPDRPPRSVAIDETPDGAILVALSGNWTLEHGVPAIDEVKAVLAGRRDIRAMILEADAVAAWDSALVSYLLKITEAAAAAGVEVDTSNLPDGIRRLLKLATAVAERTGTGRAKPRPSILVIVGNAAQAKLRSACRMVTFVGELAMAVRQFVAGRARYRRTDLLVAIQECGAQALPIVTIISVLVGLIFAFVGAIQLRPFGAQIYVANLVGVAMAREMAAVMTAIVLAGRTGAAFAAQLGTMQANEEIDALSTLGIPPMEYLVLPRVLALVLMTPLLCIYSDLMGMIGGWLVGVGMLGITSTAYILQTEGGVTLTDFAVGIAKSSVFGLLVAIAGCLRGLDSGRTAAAVGDAATSAVVTGILCIIIADAIFTVLLNILGL
jgi:phospholipid/cholesterol/gamma-HCH transport system permease protein